MLCLLYLQRQLMPLEPGAWRIELSCEVVDTPRISAPCQELERLSLLPYPSTTGQTPGGNGPSTRTPDVADIQLKQYMSMSVRWKLYLAEESF